MKYVPLADYQRLEREWQLVVDEELKKEALLKRWNEIAPELSDDQWSGVPIISDKLTQLIQDTKEVLK